MTAWLPDPARSRAVLIGVSAYDRLSPIAAARDNVTDLAALLTRPDIWGLPAGHCTVVPDPASAADLLDPIHEAALAAEDALIVYAVGHGLLGENAELYLALPDATQERLHHAVRFADIRREVVTTARRCRAKVVILDCCYSGRAMAGFLSGPEQFADQTEVEGAYLLTATAETVPALAPRGERYTAFTGTLIGTLRDGVPDGPDLLDMDTVHTRVSARMRARNRPEPQRRSRNSGHLIAIARNVAVPGAPEPPPPPPPPVDRRWWWMAAVAVVLAAVAAVVIVLIGANRQQGAKDGARPPAPATSAGGQPPSSPAGQPDYEEVVVGLNKSTRVLGARVRITTYNGPFRTTFTVVTPADTCRVTALPTGESVVIAQAGGEWVRVTPIDDFPEAPDLVLPVRFSVEWGRTTPAPEGSRKCD